jgi:RNA polymerase sigma factor (sigma-70 family)
MPPDDRSLLARFAAGDQAAFATLVDRHGPLVWGVCRRATRSAALAEDAFQAVFVILARKASVLTLRTSLANWLFGVAIRVAKRAARREERVKQVEQSAAANKPRDGAAPEADRGGAEWNDLMRVLDEELGQLSERHRGPLVACYLQGKTQDEAAVELGWTVFTLRRRLAEARDVLRARLTRRGATFALTLFAGAVFANVGFAAPLPPALAQTTVAVGMTVQTGGTIGGTVGLLAGSSSGWSLLHAILVALGLGTIGVGGVTIAQATRPPTTADTSPTTGPMISEPEPTWVTIRGRVIWPKGREIPKPVVLSVTADKATCCRAGDLVSNKLVIDEMTRGVRNVVVWLRPDTDDRDAQFPADRIHPALRNAEPKLHEIDQPECQFEPRVIAARAGDKLLVKNSSAIAHNVNFTGNGLEYNRTLPASKSEEKGPLDADHFPAVIRCNIHPWMEGRLRVFDHPYFAVTNEDDTFEIRHAPAGKWRIVYWHEMGYHRGKDGANGTPIEVKTTRTLEDVEIELPGG